jgi:hypothetical protein
MSSKRIKYLFAIPCAALVALTLAGLFTGAFSQAISPLLVGQNAWMDPNTQMWQLATDCGVQSVRIGGAGYDNGMPSNATLMTWVTAIKKMGAEPIMQVSRYGTAAQAAALVTYFNKTSNVKVTYWSIGNEPDLNASPGAAAVGAYIKSFSTAMKAVDPSIKIYVPDCAWLDSPYYTSLIGGDQDVCGKDANGNYYIDGAAFHTYPFGASYSRDQVVNSAAAGIRSSAVTLKGLLSNANTKNNRTGANALGWGLTEFNITYANPSPNNPDGYGVESFLNGQFFAEVYGVGMAYSATFINTWSMFESNGSRNSTDLSFVDGTGMTPRSSYYHMQLIAKNFSGTYAAGTSNLSNIRAYGCKDTGKICVMLLNEENTAQRAYTVQLNTTPVTGTVESKITIDAGCNKSYSSTIGNQSTQVLVFSPDGQLAKKYTYSLTMYSANQAPSVETFTVAALPDKGSAGIHGNKITATAKGNSIDVSLPKPENFFIQCVSPNGMIMKSVRGFGSRYLLDAAALSAGTYFVRISSGAETVQRSIVVGR